MFERIAYKASLPQETHFYDLRHSCVTLLLARGTDAKTISDLLCHSAVAIMLNTYGHVMPNRRVRAADMMGAVLAPGVHDQGFFPRPCMRLQSAPGPRP